MGFAPEHVALGTSKYNRRNLGRVFYNKKVQRRTKSKLTERSPTGEPSETKKDVLTAKCRTCMGQHGKRENHPPAKAQDTSSEERADKSGKKTASGGGVVLLWKISGGRAGLISSWGAH